MSEIITYLLHADTPSGPEHYVGSTIRDRFERRMSEHSLGSGSPKTRRWCETQCDVYVAMTWLSADRTCEYQFHSEPNLENVCPVCSPQLDLGPQTVHRPFRLDMRPQLKSQSIDF